MSLNWRKDSPAKLSKTRFVEKFRINDCIRGFEIRQSRCHRLQTVRQAKRILVNQSKTQSSNKLQPTVFQRKSYCRFCRRVSELPKEKKDIRNIFVSKTLTRWQDKDK